MRALITSICLLVLYSSGAMAYPANRNVSTPHSSIISSDNSGCQIIIEFDSPAIRHVNNVTGSEDIRVEIPGTIPDFDAGLMQFPSLTKLIAVPDGYSVRPHITRVDAATIDLSPHIDRDELVRNARNIDSDIRHIPSEPQVIVGKTGWMRWLRVAPVVIYPGWYDAQEHVIKTADHIEVEFEFYREGEFSGITPDPERYWSPDFQQIFDAMLLNPPPPPMVLPGGKLIKRGSYVIITDDILSRQLGPIIEWKKRKGFDVVVSEMVPNVREGRIQAEEIRDFILDAYENWTRPPEYVLLVGDINASNINLPAFRIYNPERQGIPSENNVTDLGYGLLAGDDYFPEVFIGRLSIDSPAPSQVRTIVQRVVDHDKAPRINDPAWYHRATLFGGNYGESDRQVRSTVEACKWLGVKLRNIGYDVEEFYIESREDEISYSEILRSLNRGSPNSGVNINAYRGWADAFGPLFPDFQRDNLSGLINGPMLPIMTYFVCATGNFGDDDVQPCYGEKAMFLGTVDDPYGAVAFFGASDLHTKTLFNNILLGGFYSSLIDLNMRNISQTTFLSKLHLWNAYPHFREMGGDEYWVEFNFKVYNLLGDPDMALYLDPPYPLIINDIPEQLFLGQSSLNVAVENTDGEPVSGAMVTAIFNDYPPVTVISDDQGQAFLPLNLIDPGTVKLTATAQQAISFNTVIDVVAPEHLISVVDFIPYGNEFQGRLLAGEDVSMYIALRNNGTDNATGIVATVNSLVDGVVIVNGEVGVDLLETGADIVVDERIVVLVEDGRVLHGGTIPFEVIITDEDNHQYREIRRVETALSTLQYVAHEFDNLIVEPGQTSDLVLTIHHDGIFEVDQLNASIHTYDEAVEVVDGEASFGAVGLNSDADCSNNPFRIRVQDGTYSGRQVNMRVVFTNGNGSFVDQVCFPITVGSVSPTNPLGPDAYGYFAYENIDTDYDEAPNFNWIELDLAYDGTTDETHYIYDDKMFRMNLPFNFRYYGYDFSEITVCDNGWLSFGDTRAYDFLWWNFRNWPLPSPIGVPNMLCPYWEDLVHDFDGDGATDSNVVLTRYDEDEARFIIEWSRSLARSGAHRHEQTFEVILYDQDVHQTASGDGEFVFQYLRASIVDEEEKNYVSVGMQDYSHKRGLQVTYANIDNPACGRIQDGRAIKFTTDPPDGYNSEDSKPDFIPSDFMLYEPYPNPFNSRVSVRFDMPIDSKVKLQVFDMTGRQVADIADGYKNAGVHTFTWNADKFAAGVYLIQMKTDHYRSTRKVILMP